MMRAVKLILVCLIIFGLSSCDSENEKGGRLIICAAASSQFAFKKMANRFSENNNIEVDIIVGSSGKLTTQILNGAPFDIFVAADLGYPELLKSKGKTVGEVYIYGIGVPVLWTMNKEYSIENAAQAILNSATENFAIANPKHAPFGKKAVEYLKTINAYEVLSDKLVYGESISQVNEYVLNKVVRYGITAKSILLSRSLKNKGQYKELGKGFNFEQGLVLIKNKKSDEVKQQFLTFVKSDEGRIILKEFGYEEE